MKPIKRALPISQPRPCGDCHVCCGPLLAIDNGTIADHPAGMPCPHLSGVCTAYDVRPPVCRVFQCEWSLGMGTVEERPDKSGLLVMRSWLPAYARAHRAAGIAARFLSGDVGMVFVVACGGIKMEEARAMALKVATRTGAPVKIGDHEYVAPQAWIDAMNEAG